MCIGGLVFIKKLRRKRRMESWKQQRFSSGEAMEALKAMREREGESRDKK